LTGGPAGTGPPVGGGNGEGGDDVQDAEGPGGEQPKAGGAAEGGEARSDIEAPTGGDSKATEVVDAGEFSLGELEDAKPFSTVANIDHVRGRLALNLFWLFAATAVGGILLTALIDPDSARQLNVWLDRLLPAQVGVLGSVLGFYYGTRR
jgi:hypothetical protein